MRLQGKPRDITPTIAAGPDVPRPRGLYDELEAHASPARELQIALAASLESSAAHEPGRWPGAVRLGIIGGGSSLMWWGLIVVVRGLIKL